MRLSVELSPRLDRALESIMQTKWDARVGFEEADKLGCNSALSSELRVLTQSSHSHVMKPALRGRTRSPHREL